jgi:prevent-host-death family protein
VLTGHVLLIDDKRTARASHSSTLKNAGFAVTEAKDGKEALLRLASGNFDVILADICMPEKNGLDLLQRLHTLSPDVPVIVMVSLRNNQFAVDAAELGAVQSLERPVAEGLLRRTVSHAIGLKQSRRERPSINASVRVGDTIRMNATKVKNRMGQVLDRVMQGDVVLITRHDTPKAAVIPMAEFEKLSGTPDKVLSGLSRKYDAMLTRMQTPAARKRMKTAFSATPKQLAEAALEFARKRG